MTIKKKKRLIPPFYKMDEFTKNVKKAGSFVSDTHNVTPDIPIHFVHLGHQDKIPLLFIHGSPGCWEGWAEYLQDPELQQKYFMVAVDRPAYGGSNNGVAGASLETQSHSIMSALEHAFPNIKKWNIVGHSYGGPVALRLAVDFPLIIQKTILLAPAISPQHVRVRFYNRIAGCKIIRLFLPADLHHSNEEMLLLPDELTILNERLKEIQSSVMLIQGEGDAIVHPDNAVYAQEQLINARLKVDMVPKRGHFLPWEEYERVKAAIMLLSI